MSKYYVCEGNASEGVTTVTLAETAEEALLYCDRSTDQVHFVSTVNPLENDENVQLQP